MTSISDCLSGLGRYDEADALFERALVAPKQDWLYWTAYLARGNSRAARGDRDGARADYQAALGKIRPHQHDRRAKVEAALEALGE